IHSGVGSGRLRKTAFQKCDLAHREALTRASLRGQEKNIASPKPIADVAVNNVRCATDADDNLTLSGRANGEGLRPAEPMEREVCARDELLADHWLGGLEAGINRRGWPMLEVDAAKRLLDVQIARLAGLSIDAPPIVEAIGDVTRLLH